jgi:hypothetical protein
MSTRYARRMKAPAKTKKLSNPDTKAKTVSAALEVFAEHGYSKSGSRIFQKRLTDIPKAALFEAALRQAVPRE